MFANKIGKALPVLMLVYGAASLGHFIHNAEFLRDYPGLPATWTRAGVYAVWLGMTGLGLAGWWLFRNRFPILGLLLVCVYAALGMDSLGHYVLASFSEHTAMMNLTILLEVTAAAAVLVAAVTLLAGQMKTALERAVLR